MPESQLAWVIVSKSDAPAAGSYSACPALRCGRGSPALPLAIQCISRVEAQALFRVIQPVLATLPVKPSTSEILSAFGAADAVRNFFGSADNQFYVVIVGSPPGIHRSRESAIRSQGSFSHPFWKQVDSFWEALAFLIVKGNADLMPPFDTPSDIPPGPPPLPDDMEPLGMNVLLNLRLTAGPSRPRTSAAQYAERVGDTGPVPQVAVGIESQSPLYTQADERTLAGTTAPTPFVTVHIRNLRGIIESRYSASLPGLDEARVHAVGPQAARYLVAHGYTSETVDIILRTREATTSSYQFALQLSAHGMAFEEAMYLHGLFGCTEGTKGTYDWCMTCQ